MGYCHKSYRKSSLNRADVIIKYDEKNIGILFYFLRKNSLDDLPLQFQGDDRIIAKTLVSWLHNGSHSSMDDFNYTPPHSDGTVRYLTMFKNVFQKAGHIAHYNMMMRIKEDG